MSKKEKDENKSKKARLSKESFKSALRILRYLKPHRFAFFIGIVIITISSALTLLVTRLWGQLGGVGTQSPQEEKIQEYFNVEIDMHDLKSIALLIFIVLLVQAVMSFGRVYMFADITEKIMLKLRKDTYTRLVRMPMQYFNEQRVGDLNSRISSDITSIQDVFTTTLVELFRQFIIIIGGILALLYFSPTLTFIMLGTLPVMIVVAVVFGRFIRKLSKKTQDKVAESNVIVQETFTGIINVKSFANEAFEILRYVGSITQIKQYAMKGAIWRGAFSSFIIVFIFGAITLIIWQGSELAEEGVLNPDQFFAFLLMTGLVAGSIGGLASQFGTLQKGIGAIENVMDILELEPEVIEVNEAASARIAQEERLSGAIQFEKLSFEYASRKDITVLRNVSFNIEAGKQVALVGSSGSGKSTLASLVLRLYDPSEGAILMDGKDAREYDLTYLRSHMAYVPQEVILFGGTIRENIAYGDPNADESAILLAAKQANAMEFIDQFPDGLDTVVGERGIQLSGGQRQRIAIARAVLKNPRILILDEATSALDSESERLVQDALDKLMQGRTSLVIAHRLSTIRKADNIIVLEQGEVKEMGTHDELMQVESGVYRHLSELQGRGEVIGG
ncbi:MAG: ABC transporter ATP-binding protein [Flavobacteriales bacterium]|nr:ABC transporter ATP-binding protein [Flavobacteriales bacterium]MDG1767035.1 ABC transporter ATP-binding protein [Flavobacteriales bacterium]